LAERRTNGRKESIIGRFGRYIQGFTVFCNVLSYSEFYDFISSLFRVLQFYFVPFQSFTTLFTSPEFAVMGPKVVFLFSLLSFKHLEARNSTRRRDGVPNGEVKVGKRENPPYVELQSVFRPSPSFPLLSVLLLVVSFLLRCTPVSQKHQPPAVDLLPPLPKLIKLTESFLRV